MVAEPNGDLRIVKYVADISNGFKADVTVQPGGSPMKPANSKEELASYNDERTGISPPPKQHNRKPVRGFNPIIVKSVTSSPLLPPPPPPPSVEYPYPYYKESTNSTSVVPQKSVQVELTYKDDSVIEKIGETALLQEKKYSESSISSSSASLAEGASSASKTVNTAEGGVAVAAPSATENGLYQLGKMDIPSSVIEILNQQKSDLKKPTAEGSLSSSSSSLLPAIKAASEETNNATALRSSENSPTSSPSLTKINSIQQPQQAQKNASSVTVESTSTAAGITNFLKKVNLPQRPMRLIGLSPIYVDHPQLQSITDNLTSISQVHLEPVINIQYATPVPFHSGPLLGGPLPFRNIPRSVPEASDSIAMPNLVPLLNSLPISAPIVSSPQQAVAAAATDIKQQDSKIASSVPSNAAVATPAAALPLCTDCLLPPNYMSYPVFKMPLPNTNNQKQCPPENVPHWMSYKPGFAYILMPSQIIKNNL